MPPLVTGFNVCGLLCSGLGDRGLESWLSNGRNSVPRPTAAAPQLPVAAGAAVARRPGSSVPSALLTLGSLWLQT